MEYVVSVWFSLEWLVRFSKCLFGGAYVLFFLDFKEFVNWFCGFVVRWTDLDVASMMEEAKTRWLRPNEIHAILCNSKCFSINAKPVNLPKSNYRPPICYFQHSLREAISSQVTYMGLQAYVVLKICELAAEFVCLLLNIKYNS